MTPHCNRYGSLAAEVYHLDKYIGRSFGDIAFYLDRLRGCEGVILEPAVGNGRMLVPLLERGFQVKGFDASAEMLHWCREACEDRGFEADVSQETFESFQDDTRFAAAIIPLGSFQLITDYDAALRFLRSLFHHLRPGGRLIFDIDPMQAVIEGRRSVRTWDAGLGRAITLTSDRLHTDYISQTTLDFNRYECWLEGNLKETQQEHFALRWWGVEELRGALKQCGFQEVTICGNYTLHHPPRQGDEVITFEAIRTA